MTGEESSGNRTDYAEGEELSEEEHPHRQRFSVIILWSQESGKRISPGEMETIIRDAVTAADEGATVDVAEIPEPTY